MTKERDEDDLPGDYASPPCFMHEVDPAYMGHDTISQPEEGVIAWRKAERQRLIEARIALAPDQRHEFSIAIGAGLDQVIGSVTQKSVSLYWPFRGEPDLRDWMDSVNARGGTCLLPIVIQKSRPLVFRAWKKGEKLDLGIWNIPVPANGPNVLPDIVIAPLVGFDSACFRLGYGGGFFDRTLAAMPIKPIVIGVGYGKQQITTIHPQQFDIPMNIIVTEAGIRHCR